MNNPTLLDIKLPGYIAAAIAVALPLFAGCSPADGGDTDDKDGAAGEVVQRMVSTNQLSNNQLSNNQLSNNQLSNNQLSNNQLSNNQLSNNALSGTGYGLEFMKYLIRCALPAGTCMDFHTSASDANVPPECVNGQCHFCGNLNLAPSWQSSGLSPTQKRWVSACMLAHVNLDHVSVQVSVRDAIPGGLPVVDTTENKQFSDAEASFYGNIFDVGPSGTFEKYVCNSGAADGPPGRVCGLNAAGALECEMTYMGSCAGGPVSEAGPFNPSVAACSTVESPPNGAVRQCNGAQGGRWDEVLTIYDHAMCGNGLCSGGENHGHCPQDCAPGQH